MAYFKSSIRKIFLHIKKIIFISFFLLLFFSKSVFSYTQEEYLIKNIKENSFNQTLLAHSYFALGHYYFEENNYEKAIEQYQKALENSEKLPDLPKSFSIEFWVYPSLEESYMKLKQYNNTFDIIINE